MAEQLRPVNLLILTTDIVSSHVANNKTAASNLPQLIQGVHDSLAMLSSSGSLGKKRPKPFVPIKKSITADYIICLEDGRKMKMLKRHLKTAYGITPNEYRERWGLAPDYPMVAPNYAAQRSFLAQKIGLGKKKRREG